MADTLKDILTDIGISATCGYQLKITISTQEEPMICVVDDYEPKDLNSRNLEANITVRVVGATEQTLIRLGDIVNTELIREDN
jgi:hypothetical protein